MTIKLFVYTLLTDIKNKGEIIDFHAILDKVKKQFPSASTSLKTIYSLNKNFKKESSGTSKNIRKNDMLIKSFDGNILTHEYNDLLISIIAKTSFWPPVEVVRKLQSETGNVTASWYKNTRRNKKGEKAKSFLGEVYLDDNSKANAAIKASIGIKAENFATCHIYDKSTYTCEYHTSIPNLILVPKSVYCVTDHLEDCKHFLRYCAYELYGFYIGEIPKIPALWNKINLDLLRKPNQDEIKRGLLSVDRRSWQIKGKKGRIKEEFF